MKKYKNIELKSMMFVNNMNKKDEGKNFISQQNEFLNIEKDENTIKVPFMTKIYGFDENNVTKIKTQDNLDITSDMSFFIEIIYTVNYDIGSDYDFESDEMKKQIIENLRPYIEETLSYISGKLDIRRISLLDTEDILN